MSKTALLEIRDLYVGVEDKKIIKGLNLVINEGETHVIMGPNGAGKSTLSQVLCGQERYKIESGSILYKGKDLTKMSIEERAREGVFMCMQHPTEIAGVATVTFMMHSYNSLLEHKGLPKLGTVDFIKLLKEEGAKFGLDTAMLKRPLNVGFSGGEKKRLEILQMSMLKPDFMILDEADSGVDIDALKVVANGVNQLKNEKRSVLMITHYQRLLDEIVPDFVHVYVGGKIVKTGDKTLPPLLEKTGYAEFLEQ